MFNRPAPFNSTALVFAAVVTLAMLGFVDGLASHGTPGVELAASQPAPVATSTAAPRG
jgi:hypothetical protein